MSDPFATAAELSLLIGTNEPDDLARMQLFLNLASAEVRRFTDQTLSAVADDVAVLEPTDTETLILPQRPVTAITTITEGGAPVTAHTFTRPGIITRTSGMWTLETTVTYDHGYAESTDEYQAIKKVVLECASNGYTMNRQGTDEVLGGQFGTQALESAGWAPAVFLTPSQKMELADFGKVLVG